MKLETKKDENSDWIVRVEAHGRNGSDERQWTEWKGMKILGRWRVADDDKAGRVKVTAGR